MISHDWLIRFAEHRIGDKRIIRLIIKWLKAGVLEEGQRIETAEGTPQGAVLKKLLAKYCPKQQGVLRRHLLGFRPSRP
jgi:RNA-directed DNA polymerase